MRKKSRVMDSENDKDKVKYSEHGKKTQNET